MWHTMDTVPKDGSLFLVSNGKEQMLGMWERTPLLKDGFLTIASPVLTSDDDDIYNPSFWHSLPSHPK